MPCENLASLFHLHQPSISCATHNTKIVPDNRPSPLVSIHQ